uniref:F-box domain-containing protein n=1 Tax=Fagus sylvatica TaxID=28930 RepID=A0A2N9GBQ0_FAGSY
MSQSQPRKKSERLPYDVVYDILTRLAVKSLMRFRCVSKSCNSIITNPIFIKTHLGRANNNGYLLYIDRKNPPYRRELCTVVYNTLTEISRFQIPFSHLYIAGFCNGMFCFHNYRNNVLYLWNPTIRKFKKLANARLCFPYSRSFVTFGLAYHAQNNDFKILRIVCYKEIGQVYMLQAKAEDFYGCTDNGELLIENATGLVSLDHESLNANKLAIEDAQWMAYTPNSMERYESNKVLYHVLPNGVIKLSRDREVLDMFDQYKKARLYNIPTPIIGLDECHLKGVYGGQLLSAVGRDGNDNLFPIAMAIVEAETRIHGLVMELTTYQEKKLRQAQKDPKHSNRSTVPQRCGFIEFKGKEFTAYRCFYIHYKTSMISMAGTDNGELLIKNATGLVSLDPESLNVNKLAIEDARWMAYTPNSMESLVLLDGLNVSSEYED